MADVSVRHTHDSSWPASGDWFDLRNHLVNAHREREDEIDEFESYVDGTTGRRRHAEERHRALHLGQLPSSSGKHFLSAPCGLRFGSICGRARPLHTSHLWDEMEGLEEIAGRARRFNEEFQASVPADSYARRTTLQGGFEGMLLEEILRFDLGCLKVLSTQGNHLGDRRLIALESTRWLRPHGDVANRLFVTARNEANRFRCCLTHCSSVRRTEKLHWGLGHCWPRPLTR